MKERVKTNHRPRTTVVISKTARKQADAMAMVDKRSFSKQVEVLIEEAYERRFGKAATA